MASIFTMRTFWWGDGQTYAGSDIRLATGVLLGSLGGPSGNALGVGSGVRPAAGNPLAVTVSSGLSVSVAVGQVAIQGSAGANAGAYIGTLDSAQILTCAAANTVNPRIDLVCVTVTDNGDNTSTVVLQIVTGTPAVAPTAPALPANSVALAQVTVPTNATTLAGGNIADQRAYITGPGGIKAVQNSNFYPTSGAPGYILDLSSGRLKYFNGTTVQAPLTAPFAPSAGGPTTKAGAGTVQTVCSATVNVDGATSVEVTLTWKYIVTSGTSATNNGSLNVMRDTSAFDGVLLNPGSTNGTISGGSATFWDSNPSAGSHTYSMTIQNQGVGTFTVESGKILVKAVPA